MARFTTRLVFLLLVAGFVLSVLGCNTVKGIGRDIEGAATAVEDALD